MKIDVTSDPSEGLRIIEFVPDRTLARIEGRNGIGKTLLAHLLELCSGSQPYFTSPRAWTTLRSNLGPTEITVSDLKDSRTITYQLEPHQWPERPEPVSTWLGSVVLDGNPAEWHEAHSILKVRRVAGDESLSYTLASDVHEHAELSTQMLSDLEPRVESLDSVLEALAAALYGLDWSSLSGAEREASLASKIAAQLTEDLLQKRQDLETMVEAERLFEKAQSYNEILSRLEDETENAEAERSKLQATLLRLDQQAAELIDTEGRSVDQKKEVGRLSGLLDKRERRLRARRDALVSAAKTLGMNPDAVTEDAIASKQREVEERLTTISDLRRSLGTSSILLELSDDLSETIRDAAVEAFDREVIVRSDETELTVAELAAGLETRHDELETERQAEPDASELDSRLERAELQRRVASELPDHVRLLKRAEADVEATRSELAKLVDRMESGQSQQYLDVTAQRADLNRLIAENEALRLGLEQARQSVCSEGDEAELYSKADLLIEGLRISREVLPHRRSEAEQDIETLGDDLKAARAESRALSRQLASKRGSIQLFADHVVNEDEFAWMRHADNIELPDPTQPVQDIARSLEKINEAVAKLRQRVNGVVADQLSLRAALDRLQVALREGREIVRPEESEQRFWGSVVRYFEARFTDELSDPELRAALFDHGTGVEVDLSKMAVTWKSETGTLQTRPLEAFSSGERAFAYSRVRLQRFDDLAADNVLVVLDEFGAFIAEDRLGQLATFIRKRVLGSIADQVLLVVPTSGRVPRQHADFFDDHGYWVADL